MDGFIRKYNKFLLTLLLITSINIEVFSAEKHEYYNGLRGLAMGGAAIAVVNDETALLVNPAALGKLRDQFITIIDPEVEQGINNERVFGTSPF